MRIIEPITFQNVVAGSTAYADIPDYNLGLHGITMKLGGTTFAKSNIDEIRFKRGSKVLSKVTGAHLDKQNQYVFGNREDNDNFLHFGFTLPNVKQAGVEMIGAVDMNTLRGDPVRLELDIASGASSPSLADSTITWGPALKNQLMRRLIQFKPSSNATGEIPFQLAYRGMQLSRLWIHYGGDDWADSAVATAFSSNTGNGTVGTITVGDTAKVGTYTLTIVEPGTNVGSFILEDPDGLRVPVSGVVATAYTGGGLSFTLSDGSTDFVAGDGFTIEVSKAGSGNVSNVEIKVNQRTQWNATCPMARYLQVRNGRTPQKQMYVADFLLDNNGDSILRTGPNAILENILTLAATESALTVYADVLARPGQV